MPLLLFFFALAIALGQSGCDSAAPTQANTPDPANAPNGPGAQRATTQSGLGFLFLQTAEGPRPQTGEVVTVHYTAALEDGTVFDSSWERDEPLHFTLGRRLVIRGWDEGIALMPLGSRIRLFIPPDLAYGARGVSGVIPPNATLIFDVELLSIRPGTPSAPTPVLPDELTTRPSGLQYIDFVVGEGPAPQKGQEVQVHFTAWLSTGQQVQTTLDEGMPYSFAFGQAPIPGWDEGVETMRVGGRRQLIIPPQLGFGEQGSGVVPPNATLVIELELLELR